MEQPTFECYCCLQKFKYSYCTECSTWLNNYRRSIENTKKRLILEEIKLRDASKLVNQKFQNYQNPVSINVSQKERLAALVAKNNQLKQELEAKRLLLIEETKELESLTQTQQTKERYFKQALVAMSTAKSQIEQQFHYEQQQQHHNQHQHQQQHHNQHQHQNQPHYHQTPQKNQKNIGRDISFNKKVIETNKRLLETKEILFQTKRSQIIEFISFFPVQKVSHLSSFLCWDIVPNSFKNPELLGNINPRVEAQFGLMVHLLISICKLVSPDLVLPHHVINQGSKSAVCDRETGELYGLYMSNNNKQNFEEGKRLLWISMLSFCQSNGVKIEKSLKQEMNFMQSFFQFLHSLKIYDEPKTAISTSVPAPKTSKIQVVEDDDEFEDFIIIKKN